MKRYLVFVAPRYYPDGGALDFSGWASTEAEVRDVVEKARKNLYDERFSQDALISIFDVRTGAVGVAVGEQGFEGVWGLDDTYRLMQSENPAMPFRFEESPT